MSLRLVNKEIDERVKVTLDKSIKGEGDAANGIMKFGENNDYPYINEKLINGSITAVAAANTYAKFLIGEGFSEEINSIIIGKDERSKPVTVLGLLRKVCFSLSYNRGSYVHADISPERKIKNLKMVPFKYCRFGKVDDTGYCAKIAVSNNWDKHETFKPSQVKWYNIFNLNEEAFNAQIKSLPGKTAQEKFDKFKGQIYFLFLDEQYLYPLSPFDSCYLDMDTENQIAIFKNNKTRNGMTDKTIGRFAEPSTEEERLALKEKIKQWQGSDGVDFIALYDDVDEKGEIKQNGAFRIDSIKSNINADLFGNWQKDLANNIRKSMKALPAILIDYEEGKLSTTSGESIIQATNYYNAVTRDDRMSVSQMFKELLTNFDNDKLRSNTDWNIKELNLYGQPTNIQSANSNN